MTTPAGTSAPSPATLAALQRRLAEVLEGLRHPPLGSVAALAEEVGETAKLLVDHHCYGKPLDRDALGAELADVFICLAELATLHDVDFEASVLAKIAVVERKAPAWRLELGAALARAASAPSAASRPD